MLQDKVLWVKKATANKGITLYQDGMTSHSSRIVQDWCKNNFKSFWLKDLWPPSSPVLNLMDFEMWSILEQKACAVSHSSINILKTKLTKSWAKIDVKTVHATCNQVFSCFHQIIREKGGCIE